MKPITPHTLANLGPSWSRLVGPKVLQVQQTFFTREPLSRLVGSYRDKIVRTEGREYYYEVFTKKILQTKYPRSAIPKNGVDWKDGEKMKLTLSFQNVVEFIVGEKLTGFNPTFTADRIELDHGWENP